MTATIRHRAPQIRHSGKDYVECPVCHVPTGTFVPNGCHGFLILPYRNASGPEDGARCKDHARTPRQRAAATRKVLRWLNQHPIEPQLVHE